MKKLISQETGYEITKLGLYQIFGGSIGILVLIWGIFKSNNFSGFIILIYLLVLIFFLYSIFCGTLCLKTEKNALVHSLTNQLIQVIGFAIFGFAFKYFAGLYFTFGINLTESIKSGFGVGISKFNFNFNIEKDRLEIDFNLIALAIIYWIDKLMKKVREEKALRQALTIGDT